MLTMRLTIKERLVLLSILPAEGNFLTLKLVRQLRELLSFSEEDFTQFHIVENAESGTVAWDESSMPDGVELPIGERMHDLVVRVLNDLDTAKKLTNDHVSLYEKFILADKQGD